MLTYELKKAPGVPLYEALYRCIRGDILSGKLAAGEKLPSKRALAAHLEVSKITVETAYSQLAAEGYITAREKVGYFVEAVETVSAPKAGAHHASPPSPAPRELVDLTANTPAKFPFSVWTRLQRQVLLDFGHHLLEPVPQQGCEDLRQAIADHLAGFRGMQVDKENIIIGAGTDFLYNLLLQLLGQNMIYALEEPGYHKIRSIYAAAGAKTVSAELDSQGVTVNSLQNADVLHFSPSHHFPSGIITPAPRRQTLLQWAATEKWIIEDDYDSEFRFDAHPLRAMYAGDEQGRVIYINSFSKSLAPSIRIAYMILPPSLMARFREKLGFYSCTVSGFEQHTLAAFLRDGHFEKHINRMRKFYRARRNRLLEILRNCRFADRLTIEEADAGLHFLVKVDANHTDGELIALCERLGLRVQALSGYYHEAAPEDSHRRLVVNYSGLKDEDLDRLADILER